MKNNGRNAKNGSIILTKLAKLGSLAREIALSLRLMYLTTWIMRKQDILQTVLFVVFFSVGAASLSTSILCKDLLRYHRGSLLLKKSQTNLKQLESLNADYDTLLEQLRKDPGAVKRIAPATLGTEPVDKKAVYPKVRAEQLAAARRALMEDANRPPQSRKSEWIVRSTRPVQRIILFFAGAGLIIISFVYFGPVERKSWEE